jgi:hypothetical protein
MLRASAEEAENTSAHMTLGEMRMRLGDGATLDTRIGQREIELRAMVA